MPHYSKFVSKVGIFSAAVMMMWPVQAQQSTFLTSPSTAGASTGGVGGADAGSFDANKTGSRSAQCEPDGSNCAVSQLLDANKQLQRNLNKSGQNQTDAADNQDAKGNETSKAIKEIGVDATEFQRFVIESTGRGLPLFGYTLFNRRQATFEAIQNIPVPAEYVLGPGDEINAQIWGAVNSDIRATIDRNGQVSIPKVGTFTLAGVKASELEAILKAQVGRIYTNFSLSASLGALRSIQVYVVGQARQPGVYTISSLSTLVNALFVSGGPAANGSLRNIQLKRQGKIIATLDMYAFIAQGDKSQDMRLLPGDVIVIPPAGPRVAVMGTLDTPGIYELQSENETLKQVLNYGGGTISLTSSHKVLLERIVKGETKAPRFVEERALDEKGLAGTLGDGDIITLFKISQKFSNAVTLRGNVASPLRYSYKPGMTLFDLLPEKEALLTPEYFLRKNALVAYEKPEKEAPQISENSMRKNTLDATDSGRNVSLGRITESVKNLGDEPNWEYAIIERMNSQDLSMQIIPFNLGEVVLKKNPQANLALQPGDIVTIFGKKDIISPISKRTMLVRVEGEVNAPGIYQIKTGETLLNLLTRVGGLTQQAYLYGTVFTREETRKDQEKNLAIAIGKLEQNLNGQMITAISNAPSSTDTKSYVEMFSQQSKVQIAQLRTMKPNGRIALELSPSINTLQGLPDLPLEDGDAVIVPPKPGYITALGAVDNNNAIIWKTGKTVADTLRSAGVQEGAEKSATFVLRADGSVSKGAEGWFGGSIDSLVMMPGDTVVVPEKLDKRSVMTQLVSGLKDWTQIISQFGLGAAAIKVLRQ